MRRVLLILFIMILAVGSVTAEIQLGARATPNMAGFEGRLYAGDWIVSLGGMGASARIIDPEISVYDDGVLVDEESFSAKMSGVVLTGDLGVFFSYIHRPTSIFYSGLRGGGILVSLYFGEIGSSDMNQRFSIGAWYIDLVPIGFDWYPADRVSLSCLVGVRVLPGGSRLSLKVWDDIHEGKMVVNPNLAACALVVEFGVRYGLGKDRGR